MHLFGLPRLPDPTSVPFYPPLLRLVRLQRAAPQGSLLHQHEEHRNQNQRAVVEHDPDRLVAAIQELLQGVGDSRRTAAQCNGVIVLPDDEAAANDLKNQL
jgi:hypothetical protein